MLAARVGLKRAYMASWVAMGLLAFSAITPDFYSMLALRLLFGVGLALMVASSGPLVMQWFKGREVLIINAANTALLSLGVTISLAGAVPLAEWVGWKTTLTVFSGIGVLGALIWPAAPLHRDRAATERPGISLREVFGVLRGRTVALLVAADAGIFIQYTALTGWLPTFFNEVRGFALDEAGFLTSILPFVGMFAVLAGGALPMRFSYRSILIFSGLLAILGGLGTYLLSNQVAIYISVAALGIGSWLYVPALLTIPMRLAGATPERVAVVWGAFMTFSGFGMFVSPLMVGALWDGTGSFFPGFIVCGVASWALLVCGGFLPKDVASEKSSA